jgi:hypothetical protein
MANRITKADHAGGEDYFVHTFDQLDAIGVSDAVYVHGLSGHTFQVNVADVDTNVIIRFEGSLDGVNFANISAGNTDETVSADGTYLYTRSDLTVEYMRVRFVSESGSTTPTVDTVYSGRL